jgi:hypothetical protein
VPRPVSRKRCYEGSDLNVHPSSPRDVLERWEAHGGTWRILNLTERLAVVTLCTCYGAPVDELRTGDPELIRFLAASERPDDSSTTTRGQ